MKNTIVSIITIIALLGSTTQAKAFVFLVPFIAEAASFVVAEVSSVAAIGEAVVAGDVVGAAGASGSSVASYAGRKGVKKVVKKIRKHKKSKKNKKGKKNKKTPSGVKLSLASWNLQNFTPSSSPQKIQAVNGYIASLFMQGTDVVFLQELQDKQKKDVFTQKILKTKGYKSFVSAPLGRMQHKERYAILIHPKFLLKTRSIPVPFYVSNALFQRPIYGVKVKDMIFLNVHIGHYQGKGKKERRKQEVRALQKEIVKLQKKYKTRKIIIGGDFNLSYKELQKIFKGKYNITTQKFTTTANDYDHIISPFAIKRDMVSSALAGNFSDHKPIRIVVALPKSKKRI